MRIFAAIFGSLLGLVLLVAVVVSVVAGGTILYLHTFGTATQNAKTQVTRHTNQYVTTQQQELLRDLQAYRADDLEIDKGADPAAVHAQQSAIVETMRETAATLAANQVPPSVASFLASQP